MPAVRPADRLRPLAVTACLLVAAACGGGPPAAGRAERVVMVSFDGLGADLARRFVDEGTTPALGELERTGLVARLRPVEPTLTAVNHVALATGLPPASNGIVANQFRVPGRDITSAVSGFDAPIAAETVWQRARRGRLQVGVLLWPGCDGTSPERSADFGLTWPVEPLAPSAILDLAAEHATSTDLASADGVPGREWRLAVDLPGVEPGRLEWRLAAVDGTADGSPGYDTVVASPAVAGDWSLPDDSGWIALSARVRPGGSPPARTAGAWCKALRLDPVSGSVRLYRGAFWRLLAYPEPLLERLEGSCGFWPGPPDTDRLASWWLDPLSGLDLDTVLEQLERLDRYLDRVTAEVLATETFRLLLAYHPGPDEYQHVGLISDPRQWAHSPGKALAARQGLDRVGRSLDRSVALLRRALDPDRDALLVVSDHGQLPVHTAVRVNAALAAAGLVTVAPESKPPRPAPTTPMLAVGRGGCVHLYLNLAGREPGGVVTPAEAPELLRRAARALADLTLDGTPVVERVVPHDRLRRLGLDHPGSGDLVVFLRPGFAAEADLTGPVLASTRLLGDHGHHSRHRALHPVLVAAGAGVPSGWRGTMEITEVRPLVDRLLELH